MAGSYCILPRADPVRAGDAGDAGLRANGLVAELLIGGHGRDRFLDVRAIRVAVDRDAFARGAAQQLVNGTPRLLPRMSQSATSTAAIAAMVTGPRRQYAPL